MTRPLLIALGLAATLRFPWLAGGFLLWAAVAWQRRRRHRREAMRRRGEDTVLAARSLLVALTGGLSLFAGLELAAAEVGPPVGDELRRLLRLARGQGLASALSRAEGTHTRPILIRLARAQLIGAPMAEAVAAYLAELQAERRAEALDRVRRLPVTLMLPLGLLILPGFVVLFVGPIVFTSFIDLLGQFP